MVTTFLDDTLHKISCVYRNSSLTGLLMDNAQPLPYQPKVKVRFWLDSATGNLTVKNEWFLPTLEKENSNSSLLLNLVRWNTQRTLQAIFFHCQVGKKTLQIVFNFPISVIRLPNIQRSSSFKNKNVFLVMSFNLVIDNFSSKYLGSNQQFLENVTYYLICCSNVSG